MSPILFYPPQHVVFKSRSRWHSTFSLHKCCSKYRLPSLHLCHVTKFWPMRWKHRQCVQLLGSVIGEYIYPSPAWPSSHRKQEPPACPAHTVSSTPPFSPITFFHTLTCVHLFPLISKLQPLHLKFLTSICCSLVIHSTRHLLWKRHRSPCWCGSTPQPGWGSSPHLSPGAAGPEVWQAILAFGM